MTEHKDTHATHGMEDHHHLAPPKLTPEESKKQLEHQAPREVKDRVWDIIQGRRITVQDPDGTVLVPEAYVHTVATCAIRELRRQKATDGFSVKVHPDEPIVQITYLHAETLARMGGSSTGYQLDSDCLTAYVSDLDPVEVGTSAAQAFLTKLHEVLTK